MSRRERNAIDQVDATFWRGLLIGLLISFGVWLLLWAVARQMGVL